MDLRDINVGASRGHMVVGVDHKGNCKRPLYHMVSEAPKPSWNSDRTSGIVVDIVIR